MKPLNFSISFPVLSKHFVSIEPLQRFEKASESRYNDGNEAQTAPPDPSKAICFLAVSSIQHDSNHSFKLLNVMTA